ncbi:hypothetical protein [uncultured Hoeflea sp.]|uniref:hypothetical protein n=1 Tax=uncultured Hoeflea sp. TaxID=538666 RepID=UPI00262BB75D|nr:hypothetical protein [uncultured Hoeflea sp.]
MDHPRPGTRPPVNAPPLAPDTPRRLGRAVALAVLVVIGLPIAIWNFYYPTYSWGQKTVVTVMTPEGERSGSAVVQVSWKDGPDLLADAPHLKYEVRGEATVVDLGNGKYLFALIKGAERRGLAVFGGQAELPRFTNSLLPLVKTTAASRGESSEVPPIHRPLLVTFADINDPASVARVDPDDLAASFGEGYALSSIALAITDEWVTKGRVEAVLVWINSDEVLKNPVWSSLPSLAQTAILGLKRPIGE